jgi:leucyl-tRNA synthetase
LHAAIKKVTEDLEHLRFNTAIAALMEFIKKAMTWEIRPATVMADFLRMLQPLAPHLAEELWSRLTRSGLTARANLTYSPWPKFDAALLVEDTLEIPVQVNGKLRDVIKVPANASQQELERAAKASEKVTQFINGKVIRKIIVVPGRLVNIIVG